MRAMPVALLCLTLGACASTSTGPTPNLPPRCPAPPYIEGGSGYQVQSSGDAAFAAVVLLLGVLTSQAAPTCP